MAIVLLGTFFGTFNNSAASVALVKVLDEYRVGIGSGVWFVTSYVVAFAVTMPLAGVLADRFGTRRIYLVGLVGFLFSSLGVALAPSYPWLIGLRTLQGVFNGPVLPTVMVTAVALAPGDSVGKAMGAWAAVNGAAIAIGPPIAGVLTDSLGWRSVFWLQVPLLAGVVLATMAMVPDVAPTRAGRKFDLVGVTLLTIGLIGVMVGFSRSSAWGWGSPLTWGVLAGGAGALAAFGRWSRSRPDPVVDPRLFASRAFSSLAIAAGLQMVVLYGVLLAVPLLLVDLFGFSITGAGAFVFVLPLTMIVCSPISGWLADRYSVSRVVLGGGAALALGAGLLVASTPARSPWIAAVGLAVIGFGVAAIQSPTAAALAGSVDGDSRGTAIGLFHTIRFLAGAMGSVAAAVILEGLSGVGSERLPVAFGSVFGLMVIGGVGVMAIASTRLGLLREPLHA